MTNVYIVGLGMIRFNKYPDRNVRDMAHEVIRLALDDAGLEKEDLQAAFFANTFTIMALHTKKHLQLKPWEELLRPTLLKK